MPSWNMLLDDNFLSSVELNYSITAKDFKVESISTNLSYFKQLFAVFTLTYVNFFWQVNIFKNFSWKDG